MRHTSYFSEDTFIVGMIATLLVIILFSIITFMWLHIESQNKTILALNQTISEMERSRTQEKNAIRNMSLNELFDRLDSQKTTRP